MPLAGDTGRDHLPATGSSVREPVHGRPAYLRFNQDYSEWTLSLDRVVTEIDDFWPEPYAPPAGREHLVERY